MVYKQCLFIDKLSNPEEKLAGIAVFNDYLQGDNAVYLELQGVICTECGEYLEAEDVEIVSVLENWWSINEEMKDLFYPDDTRGFRPEDQISMKFD